MKSKLQILLALFSIKMWLLIIPTTVYLALFIIYGQGTTTNLTFLMTIIGTLITWGMLTIQKHQLLQGTWTSLGILFTFVALGIAFKDTSHFINSDGKLELSFLLPFLSSAFMTSIVGISIGVFFSLRNKYYESKEEKEIPYLNNPPEKILYDIKIGIEQISSNISQDIAKMMVPFFKNFNETVLSNMEPILLNSKERIETLNSIIENQLKQNIESYNAVNQKIEDLTQNQSENAKRHIEQFSIALDQMVSKVSENIDAAFQNNITMLDETFENLKDWQLSSKANITTLTTNFKTSTDKYHEFVDSQYEILEQVKKQLSAIELIRKTRENEVKVVSLYDEKLTQLIDKIEDINKVISKLDGIYIKVKDEIGLESIKELIIPIGSNGSSKHNGENILNTKKNVQ